DAAEHLLQLEQFRRDQVLELRLRRPPLTGAVTLHALLEQVASSAPTPGGGTVAAVAGALAAALAAMVAGLTLGRKKYAAAEATMRELRASAHTMQSELLALGRRDSAAFEAVLQARRLPDASPDQAAARTAALQHAELDAARVPLATARAALAVLELA